MLNVGQTLSLGHGIRQVILLIVDQTVFMQIPFLSGLTHAHIETMFTRSMIFSFRYQNIQILADIRIYTCTLLDSYLCNSDNAKRTNVDLGEFTDCDFLKF